MSKLDLTEHPWLVIASLLPIGLYVIRRCQKMDLSPLLPLAGLIGGFWLELTRSGADVSGGLSGMLSSLGETATSAARTQQGTDREPARR